MLGNLKNAIDSDRRFPQNVFLGNWQAFFFFDSDWLFGEEFVETAKALLRIEGGKQVTIFHLDAPLGGERSSFVIDAQTTNEAYLSFVGGGRPDAFDAWVYSFDQFACISDVGDWCIYFERRQEIAVLAVRQNCPVEEYGRAISVFHAVPIEQALSDPPSYGFTERALSAEWRKEFLSNYGTRQT
jgi:hypothetical protein